MSRTRKHITLGVAAAGFLLAAVGPATAATTPYPFPVSVEVAGGARNFTVDKPDNTALTGFNFGLTDRQLPFRVTVTDVGVPLAGEDYRVSATMSNLYYEETPGVRDYTTMIPSSALSLSYDGPPSASGLELPVIPRVTLSGALSCGTLTAQELLDVLNSGVCTLLAAPLALGGSVNTVTNGSTQVLTEADLVTTLESVAGLPFALTGAQEGGAFVKPAKISNSSDPETGSEATNKTVMKGTNLLTGDTLANALARIDAALDSALDGVPVLPKDGPGSLVTTEGLLTALSQQPSLAPTIDALRKVTDATVLDKILNGVNGTVADVTGDGQLSVMSGTYRSLPKLNVAPVTIRAGAYTGELTVDFFQE